MYLSYVCAVLQIRIFVAAYMMYKGNFSNLRVCCLGQNQSPSILCIINDKNLKSCFLTTIAFSTIYYNNNL